MATSGVEDKCEIINNNKELDDADPSPIQKLFSNTNIFLTGGTGFLGILLLEKLLASCSGISKIFLLVRNKKGKNVETRLDELFNDIIFSRLKKECPNFREKIVSIEGDCELPDLGINPQDREVLIKEVNMVFHAAATVRFDETLKKASFINVRAVRDILRLAQQMPNLKSFVHVSTAYSNCVHSFIKEQVYPPAMDYKELLNVTESLPDDILNSITPMLLDKYPNTYAYTKQIGENVVRQEGKGLPLGIHRPSIVISTYKEPLKGWINTLNGPTGYIAGGWIGLIRTGLAPKNIKSNLVPADMVINSIIASAWDISQSFDKENWTFENLPVYNFEASQVFTWPEYSFLCRRYTYKYATVKALWCPVIIPVDHHFMYICTNFVVHTLPAFLVDVVRFFLRKPPMMLKVYRKVNKMINVLTAFTTREWHFQSNNVSKLKEKMSDKDRRIFFCEVNDMDLLEYFDSYMLGIRLYLLKDPLETLEEGQRKYRRFYWSHQCIKSIIIIFLLWIWWHILSFILALMW